MIEDLKAEAAAYRARAAAEHALARAHYRTGAKALGDRHYTLARNYERAADRNGG